VALRTLVRYLLAAGRANAAKAAVDAALAAHPDAGAFHEIRGLLLEQQGNLPDARAAYRRATEIDGHDARALAGLARLAAADGDAEAAVDFYDRAAASDRSDPVPAIAAAELLARSGDSEQAQHRMEEALRDHPYDPNAALELAELLADRGDQPERVEELIRRAERFGGKEAARAVRERISSAGSNTGG
jgi:tetratricopeptide (TPR) repeat protein